MSRPLIEQGLVSADNGRKIMAKRLHTIILYLNLISMQTAKGEDDYLQLFRNGEEQGFTYYFETFYPAMIFYAFRLVQDKVIAENIVEESFIRLWKKHRMFKTEKEIRFELYNKVSSSARSWKSRNANVNPSGEETETHLSEMIRAEVTRKLYSAIKGLPPFYKQVFKLIYIQGKTLKEASEELNISESTLKDHQLIGLQYVNRNGQLI